MQAHAVHGARVDDPVPLPIKRPARAAPPSCTDALVSQAHVVVGRLVAARLQPLTHAREEGALGLGLARQLDERGLERVERQVDVEVALVVVSVGLAEPVVDDVLGALPVGRHRAQIGPDLLASEPPLDGEGCLLPQRPVAARVPNPESVIPRVSDTPGESDWAARERERERGADGRRQAAASGAAQAAGAGQTVRRLRAALHRRGCGVPCGGGRVSGASWPRTRRAW
mmetsp:Transcript_41998/g.115958  ORF Transcript_41998/g.115958 Transcript_41998/m.115958 type:complete len:228 (+) Transcript_41998:231-914(+)